MSYKFIYFGIIITIIVFGIYQYIDIRERHDNELIRIEILEKKRKQRNYQINEARLNSVECSIPDLNTPKECYLDSNYTCKWSIIADRCNAIN